MASAAPPPDATTETRTTIAWGALFLVFAVAALNSYSRAAEIPFSFLALAAPVLFWRQGRAFWDYPAARYLLLLFACYWLPMLTALPDAVDFSKSLNQTLVALRFPLAGLTCLTLLRTAWQLQYLFRGLAWLLLFWSADAMLQQLIGYDAFGLPNIYPRLSGVFASDYLRLGLYSALCLPFVFSQVHQTAESSQGRAALYLRLFWTVAIGLIVAAVWLSGTRSAWIMLGLAFLVWGISILRHWGRRSSRWRLTLLLSSALGLVIILAFCSYRYIPSVQARVQQTAQIFSGDEAAVDQALSYRLPIWRQAWAIAQEHPFNGVGARGFRSAYAQRADTDDYFLRKEGMGASHAHQLQLSIWTETGLIGLTAFLLGVGVFWRSWRRLNPVKKGHCLVAAPALSLLLAVFPLNSHLDAYASSAALMFWWLLIVYFSTWNVLHSQPAASAAA